MDDLLREFLTETAEHLDTVDVELVRFEKNPGDKDILRNIFRLVHTIKGTCGFLGLPRLESLAHAAETLMGQLRDGMPVTSEVVTLVLATVDRIKLIMDELDRLQAEPVGFDGDLISALEQAAQVAAPSPSGGSARPDQMLLRPLRPGEVALDDLERAFRRTPGPADLAKSGAGKSAAEKGGSPAERNDPVLLGAGSNPTMPTVRVGLDTLEHLMTTVSELVLTRNQLLDIERREQGESGFKAPLQRLSQVTAELQEGIMKTRMQPIGTAWAKLPRVVRDLAGDLGKSIELVTVGADTELDRQVLDVIRDPLTHMVRNSADHGIETPAERKAAGKPATATITLRAAQTGGTISIELADDGRGLDLDAIRERAVEGGLVAEAEIARMSDEQVANFIFQPGFSTSSVVNAVSGRGVGMDVVKTNIALVGGTVGIATVPGRGTTVKLEIPLTLAIVAALIVSVGDQRFAIPQVAVVELVRVRAGTEQAVELINGAAVFRLRAELLPVIDVANLLGLGQDRASPESGFLVVVQVGRQRFGLLVDSVLESEEIVVKSMSSALRDLRLFSGNTILGDGSVVLILDPNGVAAQIAPSNAWGSGERSQPESDTSRGAEPITLLVFRGYGPAPKAVPLQHVTRLEEVDATRIERLGDRSFLQYRGQLMPLLPVDPELPIRREGQQALIVVSDGERSMGLAVAEILDVVEAPVELGAVHARPDLIGSCVVRGRATEIVDIGDFLPRAHENWQWDGGRGTPSSLVLLVEDKPFIRDMLSPVIRAGGHDVRAVGKADEAADLLRGMSISMLVIDLDLAGGGALRFVEELRQDPDGKALPVIGLSSRGGSDLTRRARNLGIRSVVAPFDRSGLLRALADVAGDGRMAA